MKKRNFFIKKNIILFISFITVLYFVIPTIGNFSKFSDQRNDNWLKLNEVNIRDLLKNKKIIFVDITADWCVTCQYNKQRVINTKEIQELLNKYEVIQVQGDWTLPDKNIEKFLNNYNRFGIPFNILYSYNKPEGIIMPELLTKNSIKEALKRINEE